MLTKEMFIPKIIKLADGITEEKLIELVNDYKEHGFAVFNFKENIDINEFLINLSNSLKLGEAYVPNMYSTIKNMYEKNNLNIITENHVMNHQAFVKENDQGLHSDGTLHDIGFIKSTILLCLEPAEVGGDTLVFKSIEAFKELLQSDPQAAEALTHPQSLKREVEFPKGVSNVGPAYTYSDNELITRFTLDHTAIWEHGYERVPHLKRGVEFLRSLTKDSSPYLIKFRLEKNEGIIMANHKIAHGRTSYENTEVKKRKMLRGVFLNTPVLDLDEK